MASQVDSIDTNPFIDELISIAQQPEFIEKLDLLKRLQSAKDIISLGNGIEAQNSVVTAIACFLFSTHSYEQTIGNAIFLGGDTDTIAAMAGAISGAFLGIKALPQTLIKKLEKSPKGGEYIFNLATELFQIYSANSVVS